MLIGLTGGIGSGKSTVAAMLVRTHGAVLVDTDLIARQLTQPRGAALPALVFEDASARLRLESILHPMIGAEAARQAAAAGQANVVFDVPLLAESDHWRDLVDRVLVVDCPESVQVARVAERPGWTYDAASAVISQQATRAARRRCADAVIYNDGLSLLQLEREVDTLCAWWFASG